MSEAEDTEAVVAYCRLRDIPVYHIPNEGKRPRSTAARLKAQGMSAGVPDLCIPRARGRYHGLYIEMKHGRNNPTEPQVEWIGRLRAEGMCAYVCYGADSAIALIDQYEGLVTPS